MQERWWITARRSEQDALAEQLPATAEDSDTLSTTTTPSGRAVFPGPRKTLPVMHNCSAWVVSVICDNERGEHVG